MKSTIDYSYKIAKRIAIAVVGSTVLLLGIIMIVTPGPALIIIPLGLGILSIEFAWARSWLRRVRRHISNHLASLRATQAENHRP